jgi:hypothetical protein
MNKLNQFWILALAIFLSCKGLSSAQPLINVASSNDGNGLFSYTFSLGNPTYAWGLSTNNGFLTMRFHGIQQAFNPLGWVSSIDTNDVVTWRCLNSSLVLLGSPAITFSIQSSSFQPVLYNDFTSPDDPYPRGLMVGGAYEISSHNGIAGGYETFSYVGPAIVPEPATTSIIAVALLGLCHRRFSRGEFKTKTRV